MILYLVLYLQDILGHSALGTGMRMMVMSAGMFAAATISGRASTHVPVRLLIGAGLIGGGLGLLLMRGLGAASSWTHLIPGLILAGVGAGLVNPPLASTAVGVVRPERAGMASGINSTFRQVGIATGIAVLGTLFSHTVTGQVRATMTTVPGMSGRAAQVTAAVQSGQTGRLIAHLPPRTGHAVAVATRSAFTAGLNEILLVAAIIAFASGLVSFAAIRGQDFVAQGPVPPGR
jgi:predicted MFS family arabinose efflux permease